MLLSGELADGLARLLVLLPDRDHRQMIGQRAIGRAGMRAWAARGLRLALPLPLLVLATAAFALGPSGISYRLGARPDLRLLPPTQGASVPAPANHARFTVTRATVSGSERALSLPRRAAQRWRVGR
jgi:hypothetical protein